MDPIVHCFFIIKSSMFLFLLICLVTSSNGFVIREKRGTKIGDLPHIIPPKLLKRGEQKVTDPGWKHCIKHLKAHVMWRSIKNVSPKNLIATQFQCSWFIASEVPGSQLRISFDKMDLGDSSSCTQQFVEIIDLTIGKSQGRFCGGSKRLGDYVTVGQRVRIDIQGEDGLVEKVRASQEPFIISYKVVKEPAGFRVFQARTDPALRNKIKNSVGSSIDNNKHKNIFGSTNQPGKGRDDDEAQEGKQSLRIWQIIIIVVVCTAMGLCVAGAAWKKVSMDKKKRKKYPKDKVSKKQSDFPGNISVEEEKYLPGLSVPTKTKKSQGIGKTKSSKTGKITKSASKPIEHKTSNAKESRRHNSHGDIVTKHKESKKTNGEASKRSPGNDTEKSRKSGSSTGSSGRKRHSPKDKQVEEISMDYAPRNRPMKKVREQESGEGSGGNKKIKREAEKEPRRTRDSLGSGDDQAKRRAYAKLRDAINNNEEVLEDNTPPSRATKKTSEDKTPESRPKKTKKDPENGLKKHRKREKETKNSDERADGMERVKKDERKRRRKDEETGAQKKVKDEPEKGERKKRIKESNTDVEMGEKKKKRVKKERTRTISGDHKKSSERRSKKSENDGKKKPKTSHKKKSV